MIVHQLVEKKNHPDAEQTALKKEKINWKSLHKNGAFFPTTYAYHNFQRDVITVEGGKSVLKATTFDNKIPPSSFTTGQHAHQQRLSS